MYFSTKSMYKVYVCVPFLSFYEGNVRIVFFFATHVYASLEEKADRFRQFDEDGRDDCNTRHHDRSPT